MRVEARGCHQASSVIIPPYLLRQNLSVNWSLPSRLDWLARKPQGSTILCVPSPGITGMHQIAA